MNRVRIANLHKVKGLEAPVVILASPGGKLFSPDICAERSKDGEELRVLDVQDPDRFYSSIIKTERYADKYETEKQKREAELLRLLYVAATRAEKLLIISGAYTADKNGNETLSGSIYWSKLARLCEKDFFEEIPENPAGRPAERPAADSAKLLDNARCTDLGKQASPRADTYAIRRPSDLDGEEKAPRNSDDDVPADRQPRTEESTVSSVSRVPANVMGTMVHRLMEKLVCSKGAAQRGETVSEIINDYWHEDEAVTAKLCEIYDRMKNGGFEQQNGCSSDLLAELGQAECHCELPFCTFDSESGVLVNGVMDLVYRKDGKWKIVDYKTNNESLGLDEKYSSQLSAYRKAFKELTGEDAESCIYHIPVRQ